MEHPAAVLSDSFHRAAPGQQQHHHHNVEAEVGSAGAAPAASGSTASGGAGAAAGHSPAKEATPATPYTHSTIPLAWTQPKVSYAPGCPSETVPGPRAAHSCNIIGSKIYVFGGWNGKAGLQNLCVLDVETLEWSQPATSGTPPSARNNHATFVYDGRLYVHGGHDGQKWLGDLHTYDPATGAWAQCEVSGAVPSPRACHTITIARSKAWLVGGFDGLTCYNDLVLLDLDTMTWIQPKSVGGTPPVARNAQTVCAVGNRLFLFGGHSGNKHLRDLHVLDTERMEWGQPEMRGAVPPGLRGHTANLVGARMFLFGGYDGRGRSNELYILDTQTLKWEHPPTHDSTPAGRQRHTSCLVKGRLLFVLGGFDGFKWLNDAHVLDVGKWEDSAMTLTSVVSLLADMAQLVDNAALFPDVTFVLEGGAHRIVAHKAILCARSAHFRAMFTSCMREATAPEVELRADCMTRDAVRALMEFLYTGGVRDLAPQTALEALGVAEYTGADGLKALCECALTPMVDLGNATALLLAAQRHGAGELKKACMEFIFKHHEAVDLSALQADPALLMEIATESMARARREGRGLMQ